MKPPVELPQPEQGLLEHSQRFVEWFACQSANGPLPFSEFMRAALYEPGLGYYVAGLQKFGAGGDFTTSPETSSLFGACLAQQCREVLLSISAGQRTVFEFGAGSGKLALQILSTLDQLHCLPDRYWILEPSAELQQRQQALLQELPAEIFASIEWLDSLPAQFQGVVIANEVLDAMPVERFEVLGNESRIARHAVEIVAGKPKQVSEAAPAVLEDAVHHIERSLGFSLPYGYTSEINMQVAAWLGSLAEVFMQGAVLLVDYGYPRQEYYLPERVDGTLMCYFRQHAHSDPFHLPAGEDITAHVDFTLVAESAVAAGFELNGFATQSAFLRANNLMGFASELAPQSTIERLQLASEIKDLSLPDAMGERFHVMALSKGLTYPLQGFLHEDSSHRL